MGWVECHGGDHSKQINLDMPKLGGNILLWTCFLTSNGRSFQLFPDCQHIVGKKICAKVASSKACWSWKRMSDRVKTLQSGYGTMALGAELRTRWKLYKMALGFWILFWRAWMHAHVWPCLYKNCRQKGWISAIWSTATLPREWQGGFIILNVFWYSYIFHLYLFLYVYTYIYIYTPSLVIKYGNTKSLCVGFFHANAYVSAKRGHTFGKESC